MKKRLLSFMLTICMVLAMMPVMSITASAATNYSIWVGVVQVTSANCSNITGPGISGTVSYDPGTKILTLSDAAINISGSGDVSGIDQYNDDLTINLVGDNTITCSSSSGENSGIRAGAGLTVSGSGTLNVSVNGTGTQNYGIYNKSNPEKATTISGVNITVSCENLNGAGAGIITYGDLTISGGTVTATGGNSKYYSYGIHTNGVLSINGATVTATSGNTGSRFQSYGINALSANSNISNSTVTAISGNAPSSVSYGISTGDRTLSITSSTVTAKTNASTATTRAAINMMPTTNGLITLAGENESLAKVVTSWGGQKYVKFGMMDTYNVTYNNNGGSGTKENETAAAGVAFPLPAADTFTAPSGKAFDKWAIGSPDGTQVAANESYTFTAPTTVYALWKPGSAAATPTASFSFDGADAGRLTGTSIQMRYSLDGGSTWTSCFAASTDLSTSIASITKSNDIMVKDMGNGSTTTASSVQTIDITQAQTPTTAGKVDCTTSANNNGKLTGVTIAMEYKLSTAGSWIAGTESDITGLANGTYYVRVKATGTVLASDNQSLDISAYSAPPSGGGGGGSSTPTTVTKIESGESVVSTNLDNLVKEGKKLTVEGKAGEKLVLDTEALKNIDEQTKDSLKVEIKDVSTKYKEEHPDRLVVSLTITAGGKHITNFGNGTATVSLPYELKEGEKAEDVTVWYLAEDGTMTEVPCTYDATTKLATFKVNHFSLYVVGTADTSAWTNPFSDVKESSWFYDAVRYVSANELMNGTTDTAFNPGAKTTRGMIVTILWRMENEPKAAKDITFTDVKDGKYYHDAVAWASEKGIVGGYSADLFGPEDNITREQLAVILYHYASFKGNTTTASGDLAAFSDSGMIHSWSKDAMNWANAEGLINGAGSNLLDPLGAAERCQVAAILQRFIENTAK